jgi:hypothetical protein
MPPPVTTYRVTEENGEHRWRKWTRERYSGVEHLEEVSKPYKRQGDAVKAAEKLAKKVPDASVEVQE